MALDLRLVGQHLDPRHPVGVRPHGVVDACEVHRELAAAFLQEMREQEAHLEERQRILARHEQLAPHLAGRRHHRRRRDRLVPGAGRRPTGRADRAHQHHDQLERARDLPASEVAGGGVAPDVGRERRAGATDLARHLHDRRRGDAALGLGELGREARIQLAERPLERVEGHGQVRTLLAQVLIPVDPSPDEVAVVELLAHEDAGNRQQHRRLRTRPGRQPPVGHRRRVGQARVEHRHLGAARLRFHDALGVRVEVVAGLQMRGQQQDESRVGVIGGRPVHPVPERIAGARARRADVGVAVVAIDPPRVEDALEVDELVARPAEVVHDFLRSALDQRLADPRRDIVERLVPGDALPLAPAAWTDASQRIEDPLGVVHLVERRRAFGAVAAAAARVRRVALELLDLERLPVDVREQAAGRLAVEADRRDQRVLSLDALRPGDRIELLPVLPALDRRVGAQPARGRRQLAGDRVKRLARAIGHACPRVGISSTGWIARPSPTGPPRARARPA